MLRLVSLSGCLALGACAVGNRGIETPHQPVVSAAGAYVPGCPDWRFPLGEHESQSSNFGCAINTNLAAMIADPADLLHGRSDATSADVASRAIKAWREMTPTAKNWSVTTKVAAGGK